jgi:hypothetical protein
MLLIMITATTVTIKAEREEIKKEKNWMQLRRDMSVFYPGWRMARRVLDNDHLPEVVSQLCIYQSHSGIFSRALSMLVYHLN